MYLLILFLHLQRYVLPWHLHPTMYLLIPSKTAILIIIVQRFTSHYVSINSGNRLKYCRKVLEFTSHYVSINSFYSITSAELSSTFTSHYVSINSSDTEPSNAFQLIFTSHYVSINSIQQPQSVGQLLQDLHPTMYLLIQKPHLKYQGCLINLHPTMYLLIPYQTTTSDEQLANLHPTMYLLIHKSI